MENIFHLKNGNFCIKSLKHENGFQKTDNQFKTPNNCTVIILSVTKPDYSQNSIELTAYSLSPFLRVNE